MHVHASQGTDQPNEEGRSYGRQGSLLIIPVSLRPPEANTCSTLTTSCSGARLAVCALHPLHPIPALPFFIPSSSHHRATASPPQLTLSPTSLGTLYMTGRMILVRSHPCFSPFLASYTPSEHPLRQRTLASQVYPIRSDVFRPQACRTKDANDPCA